MTPPPSTTHLYPPAPRRTPSTTSLRKVFTSGSGSASGTASTNITSPSASPTPTPTKPPSRITKDTASSRARLMRLPLFHKFSRTPSPRQSQKHELLARAADRDISSRSSGSSVGTTPGTAHGDTQSPGVHFATEVAGEDWADRRNIRESSVAAVSSHSGASTIHGSPRPSRDGVFPAMDPAEPPQYEFYEDEEEYRAFEEGYHDVEMISAASTSIRTGSHAYVFENGRRYHWFMEGLYNFPNDLQEQDAEQLRHDLVMQLFEAELHFAPLGPTPQRILDLGTGCGHWAIDMGDLYPSAMVKGVDLSPIQPNWVPPNVRFVMEDIEGSWEYANKFDFIHARHAGLAIRNWPRLLENSYNHLAPAGWIELQEFDYVPYSIDPTIPTQTSPLARYWELVRAGLTALGVSINFITENRMSTALSTAGFINVTERIFHVPIGSWDGSDGVMWRDLFIDSCQATALGPLTRGLGWSREQVEVFLVQVRQCYLEDHWKWGMTMRVIFAQKPGGGAVEGIM